MKNDKMTLPEIFKKTYNIVTEETSKVDLFEIKPKQLDVLYEFALEKLENNDEKELWNARSPKTRRSKEHEKELIRAYFGEDKEEEDKNKIKSAVSQMLFHLGIYIEENMKGEDNEPKKKNAEFSYGKDEKASTVYQNSVIKITAKEEIRSSDNLKLANRGVSFLIEKGDYFNIINTVKKIKKKTLSPANLKLKETFTNPEDILETVLTSLKDKKLEGFRDFFQDVCTKISTSTSEENKVNDISDLTKEKDITYTVTGFSKEICLDTWIAEFENDFGEIMGPLMLMDKIKDVNIFFPSKSNEPGYDYMLKAGNKEIKISAKARGGSNNSLKNAIQDDLKDLDNLKKEIKQNLSLNETDEEDVNNLLDIIGNTYLETNYIWKQTLRLAKKFKNEKISGNRSLAEIFSPFLNFDDNENLEKIEKTDLANAVSSKTNPSPEELRNVLEDFYKKLNFSVKSNFYERLAGVWSKNKDARYGCVFYPLTVAVVKCLNNSELYKKVLEYCSRKSMAYCVKTNCTLDNAQIQLDIVFNVYDLKHDKVEFKFVQGASIWDPSNKSIGINIKLPETNQSAATEEK